jgi:NitT/TauT family transport system ATP-binding protein
MVRWGQAPLSAELLSAAKAVFRPDLYDAALAASDPPVSGEPPDGIGAFAGPAFDPDNVAGHLAAWKIKRAYQA